MHSIVSPPAPAPQKLALDVEMMSERVRRRAQVAAARARTPAEKLESARTDGRTDQASLLVMAPIKAGHYAPLADLLKAVAKPNDEYDFEVNCIIPFARIRTLHFARFVMHEASPGPENPLPAYPPPPARGTVQVHGPALPPKLLFATDFDGPLDEHVNELLGEAGEGLDRVFSHCEGWPGLHDSAAVHGYFLRHRIESNTFYTGTMHRSVDQIHREEALHEAIEGYLDREAQQPGFPAEPLKVREKIREFVFSEPDLAWARQQPGPFPSLLFNPAYLPKVAIGVGVALLAALALVVRGATGSWMTALAVTGGVFVATLLLVGAAYLFLRRLEKTDPGHHPRQGHAGAALGRGPHRPEPDEQRHLHQGAALVQGPGAAGGAGLHQLLREVPEQPGHAGGHPVHPLRPLGDRGRGAAAGVLQQLRRQLGKLPGRLHRQVAQRAHGRVEQLRRLSAHQEPGAGRRHGRAEVQGVLPRQPDPHAGVVQRVPRLSVDNINNNSRIRLGLYGDMSADEAALWVRRFGGSTNVDNTGPALSAKSNAKPAPAPVVELRDVQGLVARSFNGLGHAHYVPVRLPADAAAARAWVGRMAEVVTPGDVRSGEVMKAGVARSIGFTPQGLARLGLDDETLRTFSSEFRDGMTTSYKQRVMGDDGDSAPEHWAWGGTRNEPVHGMVFLFANDRQRLQALVDEERARATAYSVTLDAPLDSVMLNDDKEHFGFHDGIAQPRVAGFRKPDDGESPAPTESDIPPGEVVLGYVNAYGQLPDSPSVPATEAARALLPPAPVDTDDPAAPLRMDLGRNGSYVVFRQLEQHVKAFWSYLDEQARQDADRRKLLGAKIVGRWPNGAPLVRHPDQEPETFDRATANDFMYSGEWDDLRGDKCPLGAHIRRTNPRDGMAPGPAGSLLVADRHRLLRRGRAYGEPVTTSFDPAEILASDKPDTGRGLHFICFNTDLGRQFEFVQSTWVNSMKFDGLYRDADPLIGPHVDPAASPHPEEVTDFTMQRCPVRHRVKGLPRFVTTVGGAYLFMPGLKALRYLASGD